MKTAINNRGRGQVYSVGNYLMTGKNLGKGHFARVEEATHRIIGKKVAIKIIDLTCIKEEYARRNLHREPRVMARLRHPCIAALYETMMHGPRLYVVMEAACGGDLCAHVLCARGATRGLPEARARPLAAQLVSAVRHMHAQGVVHRDLKMENIMLDSTKQLIKIVDFGLSNTWSAGGSLRTPCGSLEYAAPELFVDGRRYGPEVDLWSIGVIVYGMVTGGLPFTSGEGAGRGGGGAGGAAGGGAGSRPLLRAAIARGFTRKQRAALACVSDECKTFVERLLEPQVELRMKIEDASRHRWLKRMRPPPLHPIDPKDAREIYREISEICGQPVMEVVAQIKGEPYGAAAGMYNIKAHSLQLRAVALDNTTANKVTSAASNTSVPLEKRVLRAVTGASSMGTINTNGISATKATSTNGNLATSGTGTNGNPGTISRAVGTLYANGDCARSRLPIIDEHSNDFDANKKRMPFVRRVNLDCERRLYSCPERGGDSKRHTAASDNVTNWRLGMKTPPAARILLQSNATTIKRASLGNIVSPHSSSNSHCKSERAMPVGWLNRTGVVPREAARPRRAATIK